MSFFIVYGKCVFKERVRQGNLTVFSYNMGTESVTHRAKVIISHSRLVVRRIQTFGAANVVLACSTLHSFGNNILFASNEITFYLHCVRNTILSPSRMKQHFTSIVFQTSKVFFLGYHFLPGVTGIIGYCEISKISAIYCPS
jgi:hypothetical protein